MMVINNHNCHARMVVSGIQEILNRFQNDSVLFCHCEESFDEAISSTKHLTTRSLHYVCDNRLDSRHIHSGMTNMENEILKRVQDNKDEVQYGSLVSSHPEFNSGSIFKFRIKSGMTNEEKKILHCVHNDKLDSRQIHSGMTERENEIPDQTCPEFISWVQNDICKGKRDSYSK